MQSLRDIVRDPKKYQLHEEGTKRYLRLWNLWDSGKRKNEPDASEVVPQYRLPDGKWGDYHDVMTVYEMSVRARRRQLPIPDINSPEFQRWLFREFNRGSVISEWIPLARPQDGHLRLTDRLHEVATVRTDGCKGKLDKDGYDQVLAHQAVVYAMARLRAAGRISSPGLLAVHSTGAGKTLEGLGAILAFWNMTWGRGPWAIFCISTKSNQTGNSIEKLADLACGFHGLFVNTIAGIADRPFAHGIPAAKEAIKMRIKLGLAALASGAASFETLTSRGRTVDLYTYTKFAHDCKDKLFGSDGFVHHALIIVDEIQFLLSPPSDEAGFAEDYRYTREVLQSKRRPATTWVLGMSATPGSGRADVCEILNCVRGVTGHFKLSDDLSVKARGLVSVAQLQGDLHHFPDLQVQPVLVDASRHKAYTTAYLEVVSRNPPPDMTSNEVATLADSGIIVKEKKTPPVGAKKPVVPDLSLWKFDAERKSRFYRALKIASNWAKVKEEDTEPDDAGTQLYVKDGVAEGWWALSPKLSKIVDNIRRLRGKHYVYTSNPLTLALIALLLEQELGMRHALPPCKKDGSLVAKTGDFFIILDNLSSTREVLAIRRGNTTKEFGRPVRLDKWRLPDCPAERVAAAKSLADKDIKGDKVKVVLATKENFKGVDMKGLKYIHVVEAMSDFAEFVQLVGRGPRYCSHTGLPPSSWKVTVFAYRTNFPMFNCKTSRLSYDCHVFQDSVNRYKKGYLECEVELRKAAVDYFIFKDNIHANIEKRQGAMFRLFPEPKQAPVAKAAPVRHRPADVPSIQERRVRQKQRIAASRGV